MMNNLYTIESVYGDTPKFDSHLLNIVREYSDGIRYMHVIRKDYGNGGSISFYLPRTDITYEFDREFVYTFPPSLMIMTSEDLENFQEFFKSQEHLDYLFLEVEL